MNRTCFLILTRFLLSCAVIKFDCYINYNMELWECSIVYSSNAHSSSQICLENFLFSKVSTHVVMSRQKPAHISYQICGVPAHAPGMTNLGCSFYIWIYQQTLEYLRDVTTLQLSVSWLGDEWRLQRFCFLLLLQGMVYGILCYSCFLLFHL